MDNTIYQYSVTIAVLRYYVAAGQTYQQVLGQPDIECSCSGM